MKRIKKVSIKQGSVSTMDRRVWGSKSPIQFFTINIKTITPIGGLRTKSFNEVLQSFFYKN